jgi:hypothetical protein
VAKGGEGEEEGDRWLMERDDYKSYKGGGLIDGVGEPGEGKTGDDEE